VVEPAVVAQGEFAVGVDAVAADAEVLADADALPGGDGAGPGVPGSCWGAAADGSVGPGGVVAGGELVELGLQAADGGGQVVAGEPFLQGLVEALDLAAGLRVVGAAVTEPDPERGGLAFERDPAAAAVKAGEDGAVVGEHPPGPPVAGHGQVQVFHDAGGFEDCPGGGAGQQPGVVVDDVEDLGVAAAGERPVGDVGLPDLTRANRLVTRFEPLEDVAGGVGEVGVEGEALTVDLDGR
jgi:hypothetical protein